MRYQNFGTRIVFNFFSRFNKTLFYFGIFFVAGFIFFGINVNSAEAAFVYYKSVTLAEAQSGTADSTDWPLTIALGYGPQAADADLKTVANGGYVQNSSGYDIRPYSDSALTTALTFELVNYDGVNGKLEMYVKIPTLSASTDTVIYLAFGDSGISTDGSSTATWDSSFKGVWHLPDGTTLGALDSTSNNNDGTITTPTATTGQIDGGASFNGTSDIITAGSATSLDDLGPLTFSAWIRPNSMGEANGGIVMGKSNGTGDLRFNFAGTNALSLGKDYATTDLNRTTSNSTVTMSAWNYVVVTWDGSATATNILIYVNGAETTYQTTTNGVGAIQSDAALNFNIGNLSGLFHTFDGVIDEVKVSNVARSASWITADYNAQKASSTFISWGARTASPITISGTTNAGDGITVAVAVNGTLAGQTGSTASSAWSISGVTVTSGQIITVFFDAQADSAESTAVAKYDGTGDMTGIVLNTNVLSIGSVDNQSLTVANADLYDCNSDEDVMYATSATALDVQGCTNSYTDETIQIESGDTLTIDSDETLTTDNATVTGTLTQTTTGVITATGNIASGGTFTGGSGAVSAVNLTISAGTFTSTSGTLSLSGNYSNSGTFTNNSGTVTFTATDTGNTIGGTLSSASDFSKLIFNGSGGEWTLGANLETDGASATAISVAAGTLKNGGYSITGNGATDTFYVSNGASFEMSSTSAYPASFTTYTYGATSTVSYQQSSVTVTAATYGHLTLGGTGTYTLPASDVTLNGNLVVTSGATVTKGAGTVTFAGGTTQTVTDNNGTAQDLGDVQISDNSALDPWCNISSTACNTSWLARRKITLDNSASAENLTNFPVLVQLSASNIDYAKTQGAGEDIRFVDADGTTALSYEIEAWNESCTSLVWVKVPQIDSGSTTDYIYMYFDNDGATDNQAATSVWDSSFKAVYHLPDGTTLSALDSTSGNHDGTITAATATTGKVDGAASFNGSTTLISAPAAASIDDLTNITISEWIYVTAFTNAFGKGLTKGDSSVGWATYANSARTNIEFFREYSGTDGQWGTGVGSVSTGQWYHFAVTHDGSTSIPTFYLNGAVVASPNTQTTPTESLSSDSSKPLNQGGVSGIASNFLNGHLDESRLFGQGHNSHHRFFPNIWRGE